MTIAARATLLGLALLLGVSLAAPALAGDVRGRIWTVRNGKTRPAAGAKVTVSCDGSTRADAASAKGKYRVKNTGTGSCWVHVEYDHKTSSKAMLFVSADGASANLQITPNGDAWSLTVH